jgi:hypothetical protein
LESPELIGQRLVNAINGCQHDRDPRCSVLARVGLAVAIGIEPDDTTHTRRLQFECWFAEEFCRKVEKSLTDHELCWCLDRDPVARGHRPLDRVGSNWHVNKIKLTSAVRDGNE